MAKTVTFKEKYTYDASEADSKLTCRTISLLQVKRLLLEKLGTYIETKTEVANYQITKDEIAAFSAGIIKTEILEEKWDGKIYSLTAKIEADPNSVAKAIKEMKGSREGEEKIKKLENVNEKSIEQIQELKEELARIQNNIININRDFMSSSEIISAWESYETGLQLQREGKYKEAISAFNKSIKHNPKYMHFYQRGRAYMALKQYRNAISDFSTVINLNPSIINAYFNRGIAYRNIRKKKKGLGDIRKAAELGSGNAKRWLKLKGK
jgi:tetratricopeptide (TPR) repeat protein